LKLKDRTGQVWERAAGDMYDAVWVVLGPPKEDGDGHPCGTFNDGSVGDRVERCTDDDTTFWENAPFLRRLA
jgi:hypothetical protein